MRIKELRAAANLTQVQLADIMGVAQSAVASWESNNRSPRADKLPRLAAALHCSLSDLFDAEGADDNGQ